MLAAPYLTAMKKLFSSVILTTFSCLLLLACACAQKTPVDNGEEPYQWGGNGGDKPVTPSAIYPKPSGAFRIMSYNVGALGKFITSVTENADLVAAIIKELQADVVGLNELDSCNTRHNVNEIALLAKGVGDWNWHYGRTLNYKGGGYGNGIITPPSTRVLSVQRLHFQNTTNYENRGMIVVETNDYVLAASHLDHSSEDYVQSKIAEINAWVQSKYLNYDVPVFFCGDMNSVPGSDAIKALETCWEVISNTSDKTVGSGRCIDFIFHYKRSKAVKVLGGHTITQCDCGDVSKASDHFPIYVDVVF